MKKIIILVPCAVVATGGVRAQGDDLLWFVSPDELTLAGFEKKMVEL